MTNIKSQYLENQRAAIIKGNGEHVHKIGVFLSGSDPILPLLLQKKEEEVGNCTWTWTSWNSTATLYFRMVSSFAVRTRAEYEI